MKKVGIKYKEACRNYVLGFSSSFILTATFSAFPLAMNIYYDYPKFILELAVLVYSISTILGILILIIGYFNPIIFYEHFEGEYNEQPPENPR